MPAFPSAASSVSACAGFAVGQLASPGHAGSGVLFAHTGASVGPASAPASPPPPSLPPVPPLPPEPPSSPPPQPANAAPASANAPASDTSPTPNPLRATAR